jgi:hypothetical protein
VPSLFTITTGSNTVLLDAERKGVAAFTVSNITGRAVRGRGIPRPLGQTASNWLSIAGAAERDFDIAATQQYVVQVAVPMDAAPGNYTFRLDEVGVDNPDENITQGPVVAFQVAPLQEPPPRKPFPWWIVVVAAGIIVLVVLAAIFLPRVLNPPPTPTPTPTLTPIPTDTPVPPTETPVPPTDTPVPPTPTRRPPPPTATREPLECPITRPFCCETNPDGTCRLCVAKESICP